LEDKLGQIVNEIVLLDEYIQSIEDAFKTIIDIKTNAVIKMLTLFSAFLFPMTLITSFYGMNVDNLPFQHNPLIVFWIIFFIAVITIVSGYIFFKKNDEI
jgi:magnesium transporter